MTQQLEDAQYAELEDIIAMLGLEQLSPEDRNVVTREFTLRNLRQAADSIDLDCDESDKPNVPSRDTSN